MDAISDDNRKEISRALGEALVRIWGSLPAEIQRHLFEEAVTAQGENLRSPLAAFLHNYHPRTCD
jgi:hypothetical protein